MHEYTPKGTLGEKKLFIIDYDDTLAPNLHDYSKSILTFVEYCIEQFGFYAPDITTIVNIGDKIDKTNVHKIDPKTGLPFNFTARRFPTSLVESFEYIAEGIKISGKPFVVTDRHRQDVWKIGELAFDLERYSYQGLLPGVEKTLEFILDKGDDIKLVSKGEPWVQERKFKATNMKKWFGEKIYVVPTKNADVLLEHSRGHTLSNVWHVGNSIKSDVMPAIAAGIGIIYVPLETWSHEKDHDGKPLYDKLIEIDTFSDIQKIYSRL